jgi:hypothetical protein
MKRKNKPSYTVELDESRLRGCIMMRAFPWVVKATNGKVVQYAKTEIGADNWIIKQGGQRVN